MVQSLICEVGQHPFQLSDFEVEQYKKFGFDPLPICFDHQRSWRMAFRNDRFLHKRKCDKTGQSMISMYSEDAKYPVYSAQAWYADDWDSRDFGRDFDFNRPFFEQYGELQKVVPRLSLVNVGSVNSDYCNSTVDNKDCYLIFGGDRNEDCYFGTLPMFCKSCVDCDWTRSCELSYFCAFSEQCYSCIYAFNSKNCNNCAFIEDCIACSECILCFNLNHKEFCIRNEQLTKEEYFKRKAEMLNGSYEKADFLWQQFKSSRRARVVKYAHNLNCENVSGDFISNSKNCLNCYEAFNCEDCNECQVMFNAKDSFNADYLGFGTQLNFNNISTDQAYDTYFSYFTINSSGVRYSELTIGSKNIFGSIGMRNKEYCILNKQYTKEEYESLTALIIAHMKKTGEWGQFFPKHLSTFSYNQSTASFFYPMNEQEAKALGFNWTPDQSAPLPPTNYVVADNIAQITDEILTNPITCEVSKKNFLIIPQELHFYKKMNLPIPRKHYDQRYRDRLSLNNQKMTWERNCANCGVSLKSTYSPESPETIYCEKCYESFKT